MSGNRIDRKLKSTDVIDVLSDLFILRGVPGHIRSDNGPEFVAKAVRGFRRSIS
jgi:putative transposase